MAELIYTYKEALAVCGLMTVALPLVAYLGYKVIWWAESKFGMWKDEETK